jgi:hypothetical protein
MREKVRGEYRFSYFMKQKKRGKIALSFTSPEKENYLFIIYDVSLGVGFFIERFSSMRFDFNHKRACSS